MAKTISIPVDNAEKMITKHKFLLKEALAAAAYHEEQVDLLSKAVKDVTYMLTETTQSLGGSDIGAGSTGEPASSAPAPTGFVNDGAVEQVKKNDLINLIKQYEEKHGALDLDAEVIASFLLTK